MVSTVKHLYAFSRFRLDPGERRLLRDGEPVALTPKCFDLLVVLVENSGHLLEKGELLARVWPDQFVEEGSLSFNVSELRRALREGEDGRHYIETVRKKGFRFIAPVEEISGADPANPDDPGATPEGIRDEEMTSGGFLDAARGPRRASRAFKLALAVVALAAVASMVWFLRQKSSVRRGEGPPRTIAVLPFKPLASNLRDEPLEMGICNSLITRLGNVEHLVVRPTSSVAAYSKMGQDPIAAGRALRVDALLEGYIQKSQDRIQVTARLLSTTDGKSLWSGQFNENVADIFTIEDSISRQIVEALHLDLTGNERRRVTKHSTDNIEAYELYLKGRYFQDKRTPEGVTRSIEYFQEACVKDPRFAVAFAAMADSYVVLAIRADMPPKDSYQRAKAAATHALEIDATTAEAHSALANVLAWYDWDWPGADREFKRALELNANDPVANQEYAGYLLALGRPGEAIGAMKRAQHLAPLSLTTNVHAARILFFAGQYDAAIEECRKTLDMDPAFGGAHLVLGRIYTQKHLYPQAFAELERARGLLPRSAEVLSLIGYARAASGLGSEARQMLDQLLALSRQRYVSPYHFAMIYAGLGERDLAFQSLEKAHDDREGRMTILKCAPEFSALRSDPRFTRLLKQMNLM